MRAYTYLGALVLSLSVLAAAGGVTEARGSDSSTPNESILLVTTTSVRDSGLLDALIPAFTRKTGIIVRSVAVGTGAALRMGAEGNADILLTHAPSSEKALVEKGLLSARVPIMENYFILAGPPDDPAGVALAENAVEALRKIRNHESRFVSRADDSGTHKKESELFREAGFEVPTLWPNLTRTGSGMGASLLVAGQRRAYILSDMGTFLAFQDRIDLVSLTNSTPDLQNIYSVLLVNSELFPKTRAHQAQQLASYLQSPGAQEIMRTFGLERFGQPLFTPLPPTTLPSE